ncbi:MAG: hypothetical protein Q7S40_18195 [Opitutaceae bacterium]|nr:hypothetical protein [Opitutaceae bacterium]
MSALPRFVRVRQNFPRLAPLDLPSALAAEFEKLRPRITPNARIAVGVGSRGITRLAEIVGLVLDLLRGAGAQPFIIPAMGSHGGATPDGQREVLASYGITEATMRVPIRPSLEVRVVGETAEGASVYCSVEALAADGILVVNRVKPHTDFTGELGSGLLKMCVVGLGKHRGAAAMHLSASEHGHERAIRGMAGVLLRAAPILGGVAILENQFHETARVVALRREEMATGEDALLVEARRLMPLLPFEHIDLLIVDRLGKNISGTGMDTNVINRSVNGYSSSLQRGDRPSPFIRRIFVRDLTPESHGNAIGIGLADVTTTRLVRATDVRVTGVNALTSLTPQSAKLPIHFDSDREAIERTLGSVSAGSPADTRVVRIADTLSLAEFDISERLWAESGARPELTALSAVRDLAFDANGNIA